MAAAISLPHTSAKTNYIFQSRLETHTRDTQHIIWCAPVYTLWFCRPLMPFFILSWLLQKRRLSWSDTDSPSSSPSMVCKSSKLKSCEEQHQWPYVDGREGSSETPPLFSIKKNSDQQFGETLEHQVIRWSGSRRTLVHIAPIFPPPKSSPSHKGGMGKERGSRNVLLPISPITSSSSPAMQDSFVSSTTPFSEPTRYQCQSVSLGISPRVCPNSTNHNEPFKPCTAKHYTNLMPKKHNQLKVFSVLEKNWSIGCWKFFEGCMLQLFKKNKKKNRTLRLKCYIDRVENLALLNLKRKYLHLMWSRFIQSNSPAPKSWHWLSQCCVVLDEMLKHSEFCPIETQFLHDSKHPKNCTFCIWGNVITPEEVLCPQKYV